MLQNRSSRSLQQTPCAKWSARRDWNVHAQGGVHVSCTCQACTRSARHARTPTHTLPSMSVHLHVVECVGRVYPCAHTVSGACSPVTARAQLRAFLGVREYLGVCCHERSTLDACTLEHVMRSSGRFALVWEVHTRLGGSCSSMHVSHQSNMCSSTCFPMCASGLCALGTARAGDAYALLDIRCVRLGGVLSLAPKHVLLSAHSYVRFWAIGDAHAPGRALLDRRASWCVSLFLL